jgi:hypothetical protein
MKNLNHSCLVLKPQIDFCQHSSIASNIEFMLLFVIPFTLFFFYCFITFIPLLVFCDESKWEKLHSHQNTDIKIKDRKQNPF